MNAIVRLEFELAYDDVAVQQFNYYVTKTSSAMQCCLNKLSNRHVGLVNISLSLLEISCWSDDWLILDR